MSDSEEEPMMPHEPTSAAAPAADGASTQSADLSFLGVVQHTRHCIDHNLSFQHPTGHARIALCAVFLGVTLGIGSQWALLSPTLRQLGLYLVVMSTFHLLEFLWTATFHTNKISSQAFLLNHSKEYHMALAAGLAEYAVEWLFFPGLKYPSSSLFMWLGFLIVLSGQCVRTLAMFTAASNFTHIVAEHHAPGHRLVTGGIYAWCRHPSYAGWFWWSVGTQVLLGNPICICAYAAASYLFFRGRIQHEERAMIGFWGDEYVQYQKRVGSGVPFVKGFNVQ